MMEKLRNFHLLRIFVCFLPFISQKIVKIFIFLICDNFGEVCA